jgi:PAS domain S-box-containing protein
MDLSADLARTLLDLAPDPTVIVDASGKIVFANAQIEQTFGYGAAEIMGQAVEVLLPERFHEAHPGHRERFAVQPKSRPMGAGLALFGLHKSGREFPVEISLSPVLTVDGLLVVSAIRDATVRKDRESQLVEANRQKSRFLAAASHDLRQPLTTLNLLNRVAVRHAGNNAQLRAVLDRQQLALDSMSGLLASVLDISKLDSGTVVATPVVCSVGDILDHLRSDFEPQATDKGLKLIIERTPEGSNTDPELLRRLLSNLLSNAIRYTNRGSVRLSCVRQGSELSIEVSDTGVGIPPDEIERIFEEFYQVDSGTQRPEGLGLGLSIVRRLAHLLHCKVNVQSVLHEGTAFRIVLPRGELTGVVVDTAPPPAIAAGGRILVVDDEPAVAEATGLLLETEGFEVRIASCEREALDHVAAAAPDMIVSDYHLRGGETGLSVVNAVRGLLGTAVPVVFVTGDTARSAVERSNIENARLLSKPMRADDLLAVIHSEIAASRSGA